MLSIAVSELEKTAPLRGRFAGGEGGIRTHGGPKTTTVFETAPIVHSGTSPSTQDYTAKKETLQLFQEVLYRRFNSGIFGSKCFHLPTTILV
jgi:hypothetical protein